MSASNLPDNPLVNPPHISFGALPLNLIKAEHFEPALDLGLAQARAEIEAIKNNPDAPTFENTIEALEFAGGLVGRVFGTFHNLLGVKTTEALQAIEEGLNKKMTEYGNDVSMDPQIFHRVKAVYDMRETLTLTGEQKMLLEKNYKGFVRSGALLNDADKERLRAIDLELSPIKTNYGNNILKYVQNYQKIVSAEDLKGLPADKLEIYKDAADDAGLNKDSGDTKYLIRMSPYPDEVMEYAEKRALREEIYRAFREIGTTPDLDNRQNVRDIVRLRHEKAKLLGFDTWAAFVLDDRMAKTPAAVQEFLQKNNETYLPAANAFLKELEDYAKKNDGIDKLQPWDLAIYMRRLKEEKFQMKMEDVDPYLSLENVLEGLRTHAEKLFNIQMREVKNEYPVYDADVLTYEIIDKKSGDVIGVFYADYFARSGGDYIQTGQKRDGAWMTSFRERGLEDGENKIPLVLNVCNYRKPAEGKPTLISLNDVKTLFHEFGHGLHGLLAQGSYTGLTGTSVKWDFVELPSQLQENWVTEKDVLSTFAKHHETGEVLPQEMVQKLIEMENFGSAYAGLRQTFLGKLDMAWHTDPESYKKTVEQLEDEVIADSGVFPRVAGLQTTSFSHIMKGGYSSGYYSYKWAEVLDADTFAAFKKKGLYDQELGQRLRDTIYSKGGTVDPMELYISMMGRAPDPNAMFAREGLMPANKNDKPQAKPDAPAA